MNKYKLKYKPNIGAIGPLGRIGKYMASSEGEPSTAYSLNENDFTNIPLYIDLFLWENVHDEGNLLNKHRRSEF